MELVASTDVVKRFHNLEGVLIGERRRVLYKWLKQTKFSNEDINSLVFDITPHSYLEELFKVEILIFFKRTNELLEILKDGNEVFISKITKVPWFFQEAFKTADGYSFVNEFLPCLSYTTRMKVMKKLSQCAPETQMDDIFTCLLNRYGLFVAKQFLTKCSNNKIEDVLKTSDITLSHSQCKELFHKDRNLLLLYLEHRFHTLSDEFWIYIAKKDFNFFLKVENKFGSIRIKLGKRSSKKIIKDRREDIIGNVDYYDHKLNKGIMIRKLKPTFKELISNELKKSTNFDVDNIVYYDLKYFPKKFRWEIFSEIFMNASKNNILECLGLLSEYKYFTLLPDSETKIKWAEIQYKSTEDVNYLQYFSLNEGVNIIKERINLTSDIRERQKLLRLLVLICANNNNLKHLENVLQYIGYRHKNEKPQIKIMLLSQLAYNFNLETFEELHWKYINEQIEMLRVTNNFNLSNHKHLLSYYLIYLYRQNKPFETELNQFIKDIKRWGHTFRLAKNNVPDVERHLLMAMSENIFLEIGDEKFKYAKMYIIDLIKFNQEHYNSFINFYELTPVRNFVVSLFSTSDVSANFYKLRAIIISYDIDFAQKIEPVYSISELPNILKSFNRSDRYTVSLIHPIVVKLIKNPRTIASENILDTYFTDIFSIDEFDAHKPFLNYVFRYELLTVQKHFDIILNKSFSEHSNLLNPYLNTIRKCSHLKLDLRLLLFCKNHLEQFKFDDTDYAVKHVFEWCSGIQNVQDFMSNVEMYLAPSAAKLDLQNEEQRNLYQFQQSVLRYFKNVIEPSKITPLVLQYCQGDYLQLALPALYSICYRCKESILPTHLDVLAKRALSTRKHALYLTAELLDYAHFTKILTHFLSQATSSSSKKSIIKSFFKYFIKNPTDGQFKAVLDNMKFIDKNDQETLNMLCTLKVPKKYETMFIERCWLFFEDLEKNDIKVQPYLSSLLEKMKSRIALKLNFEFSEMIIRKYFFVDCYSYTVVEFAFWTFVESSPEQLIRYMTVFFDVLKQFKIDVGPNHTKLNNILSKFLFFVKKNNQIIKPFSNCWKILFSDCEYFEQFLLLDVIEIKCEYYESPHEFSEKIVLLLDQIVSQYDLIIVQIFSKILARVIDYNDKIKVVHNILKYKNCRATCLLAINLIDVESRYAEDEENICYSEIVRILKNSEDPLLKILYRHSLID